MSEQPWKIEGESVLLILNLKIIFRKTGTRRNDIIDLFMDELEKDHSASVFSGEELELGFVATAILFFFAGFDTTSTTLSVVVHALVHHPHIQEKLRKDIEDVVGDSDEITADHLKELKYIENIIFESMRRYFSFGENLDDTQNCGIYFLNHQVSSGCAPKTTKSRGQKLSSPRTC